MLRMDSRLKTHPLMVRMTGVITIVIGDFMQGCGIVDEI